MGDGIHSPNISEQDAGTSSRSFQELSKYICCKERSLVFFVGAGASSAGNTNMPTTRALLQKILLDGLTRSGTLDIESDYLNDAVKNISKQIGFEITLNDFWQICRKATTRLFESLADFEESCTPNSVHTFLAYWLSTGGVVLTTNYDRLIEREWIKLQSDIDVRFAEEGPNSFETWPEDLKRGGCLFKLHGSLDAPDSCLGALEQVTRRLAGKRANLLTEIIQNRPICFVGWQGIDPDIPPLLFDLYQTRNPAVPIFWIHYEESKSKPILLKDAIKNTSYLVREYASDYPILTEANRAFQEILEKSAIESTPTTFSSDAVLNFSGAMNECTATGVARFVGIVARRGKDSDLAKQVFEISLRLAQTSEERSAAIQESSLLLQQKAGRRTDASRVLLEQASSSNHEKSDPWLQSNLDFGILSMTVVGLQYRPWQLVKLPGLFRCYRQSIERLRAETTDQKSVALHESLYHLYRGRLRFKNFGWLGAAIPVLANWIIVPFDIARSTIGQAGDIHIHSYIDVLAYRAVALARLRRCQEAREDILEIDRMIDILKDAARAEHWERQKQMIERDCS